MKKIKAAAFLLFTVAGVILLAFNLNRAVLIYSSQSWPNVEGEIVASEQVDEIARRQSKYGSRPLQITRSDISYFYVVARKKYVGVAVAFYQKDSPQVVVEKYSVGKIVRVFFDPDDPERAVLEISNVWDLWWVLTFGMMAIIVGVAGFSRGTRMSRKQVARQR